MTWGKEIESIEIWLIAGFIVLYAIYLFGIQRKSKFLNGGLLYTIPKFILRSGYFSLLIISLMGPSFGTKEKEVKAIAKDIFIAIDLSLSMDAIDVQPSRLGKIKFELKRIIKEFTGERIGLVTFSSEAFVQCPMTYDRNALNMFTETLNTGLVPKAGTNLAAPLEMALNKHMEEEENKEKNAIAKIKPSSKIIILISDGEDFSENALEQAEEIKAQGIKLFALGIGTAKGSKIPKGNSFIRDQSGTEIISKLNRSGLKQLASVTGGRYYEINRSVNEVEKMIHDIQAIKGETRDKRKMDVATNKYIYFLLAAVALIGLDVLITINVFRFK